MRSSSRLLLAAGGKSCPLPSSCLALSRALGSGPDSSRSSRKSCCCDYACSCSGRLLVSWNIEAASGLQDYRFSPLGRQPREVVLFLVLVLCLSLVPSLVLEEVNDCPPPGSFGRRYSSSMIILLLWGNVLFGVQHRLPVAFHHRKTDGQTLAPTLFVISSTQASKAHLCKVPKLLS
jgi:hypothetical protein